MVDLVTAEGEATDRGGLLYVCCPPFRINITNVESRQLVILAVGYCYLHVKNFLYGYQSGFMQLFSKFPVMLLHSLLKELIIIWTKTK